MDEAPLGVQLAPEQAEIVAAFISGALTGGVRPERIDTHISHVFLAGARVYKLKRAVKLPFVDFSKPEQRRAACAEELAINRRLAPDLYLEVKAVTRAGDGTLALDGAGVSVEWVVVMKRFAAADLFDTMAKDGRLEPALIVETAKIVADFHGRLPPVRDAAAVTSFARVIADLDETEREGAARHGRARIGAALFDALRQAHAVVAPLVAARLEAGKVRRGHGDLHLRNICLFEGAPTPFDAIEFDARLATCDVLYDFAFLLMDLVHRGLKVHANGALNAYFDAAGEDDGALALISFFMGLRAAVRMAVLVQAGDFEEADTYRVLGLSLLAPCVTQLVAIGGLSGTGKSVAARGLAPDLPGPCGARILRSDVVRKVGKPEGSAPPEAYTDAARARIYEALAARAAQALAGASVILDATFELDDARCALAQIVPLARCHAFWLTAPPDIRVARVTERRGDVSDADAEVARAQSEPENLGALWQRIDASRTPDETLRQLRAALAPILAPGK